MTLIKSSLIEKCFDATFRQLTALGTKQGVKYTIEDAQHANLAERLLNGEQPIAI